MDYAEFVRRGEPDWSALTELLARARGRGLRALEFAELERLAGLHRRSLSDFAHARSHYPGAPAIERLRALAFEGHQLLAPRPAPVGRRLRAYFLGGGYRRAFRAARVELAASLGIFVGATLLGFVATGVRPDVVEIFVGAEWAQGLRRGEIWTDHLSALAPAHLAARILTNNISVALVAWVGGATAGLLTLYVLLMNGAMFGSVLAAAWSAGLLDRLVAFIGAHGPLELTLVVVAGAAGLRLASGQLVSRGAGRAEAFSRAGRESLALVGGALPWFVVLGALEGWVSPVMTLPVAGKLALGIAMWCAFLAFAALPVTE